MESLLNIVEMDVQENTSNINRQKLVSFTKKLPIFQFFNMERSTFESLPKPAKEELLSKYYIGMCQKEQSELAGATTTLKCRSIYKDNQLEQRDEMFEISPASTQKQTTNIQYFENNGFFGEIDVGNDPLPKLNTPERTLFYINQAYENQDDKKDETYFYNDVVVLGQEAEIGDESLLMEDDTTTEMFVPIYRDGEYCGKKTVKGVVSVLNNYSTFFVDYGYKNGVTPSQQNKQILTPYFSSTAYPGMKKGFKNGKIPKQKSHLFFYVTSTIDRNDPSDKFKQEYSPAVRTNMIPYEKFMQLNEDNVFDPSDLLSDDATKRENCATVIKKMMQKISVESNTQFTMSEIRSSKKRTSMGASKALQIFGNVSKKIKMNINKEIPSSGSKGGNFYIDEAMDSPAPIR